MATCIFDDGEINAATKPEHILLSALGGRKTTQRVVCSACNGKFGSTTDRAVTDQVATLRNMLQLDSGTGRSPPMLRKVSAGNDTINMNSDGTLELVSKPFVITPLGDGRFQLNITARSIEEIAACVPHIAAQLRCSEEQVLQHVAAATGKIVSRRPGVVHFPMAFGGELAIRSFAKSCLVLWATLVGNDEVKGQPYDAARQFIIDDDEDFAERRVRLDSRFVPPVEVLKRRFGDFFNLIYVRSDKAGQVIGYFTLYNVMAWQFVLAESGGRPNSSIGLVSNPMDPAVWSDAIAEEIDIDFSWLNSPDYSDELMRGRQRLGAAIERAQKDAMSREFDAIIRTVFDKYGVAEDAAVEDSALRRKISAEISHRAAFHFVGIPFEETIAGEDVVARIRKTIDKDEP